MVPINVAALLLYSAQVFAFGDFEFRTEKSEDLSSCTFNNGTAGRCVSAFECPSAVDEYRLGISPTLCHFVREPIVCCKIEMVDFSVIDVLAAIRPEKFSSLTQRRISAAKCEEFKLLYEPVAKPTWPPAPPPQIAGGLETFDWEFPHMAALGWFVLIDDIQRLSWRCGGTLISYNFVLTAAHCVIGITPPDRVTLGSHFLSPILGFSSKDFWIESIIGHPNYRPNQFYDDIALIKLDDMVRNVRPACLWQENEINFPTVVTTGYGHTEFGGQQSDRLLKAELQIYKNNECTWGYQRDSSLRNGIIDSQLCAGDPAGIMDACQGDSGGPLQVSTDNDGQIVFYAIGITSFGQSCASTVPGVYTRVSHYLEWIENIVWP